jgi:cysteine-rich repeat protein
MRIAPASCSSVLASSLLLVPALAVMSLLTLATNAQAHDIRLPVAADELTVHSGGPGSPRYEFHFSDQQPIILGPDPRIEKTAVLVYGTGLGAGSTGRLDLNPLFWSATPAGFLYTDPTGETGFSSIVLEQGELHVVGSAAGWPWSPTGQVEELWFHFLIEDEWLCAEADPVTATQFFNRTNRLEFLDTTAPFGCPEQVCGNGIREPDELCDDGNLVEGDGCSNDCQSDSCDDVEFSSTYEGIQSIIFDSAVYECTNALCHGARPDPLPPGFSDLELTAGISYDQLVDVASSLPSADGTTIFDRVEPGEPIASFLYEKLAARTIGTPTTGTPMPQSLLALIPEHLQAIEKWIRAGAPRDLVVADTAPLLGTCLPPEDPLKLDPAPEQPPAGEAIQFRSSAWVMPTESEDELCFATLYDFTQTELVPPEHQLDCPGYGAANNPSGKCFYYDRRILRQDAQSHHSIIHTYLGSEPLGDHTAGKFGPFTHKPNFPTPEQVLNPAPCDPTIINSLTGQNDDCSGVTVSGVACTGYGPTDFTQTSPSFAGSQEPYVDNPYFEGVYAILPMSGIIVWNSHAFNLSDTDTTMAHYLDIFFGEADNRKYPARGIFDVSKIFIQRVPPGETREYCKTYTVPRDSNIFELSSHTHRWGSQFRIWGPPQEQCYPGPGSLGDAFDVLTCEPNCACEPGDPSQLLYFSTQYTDPVQLEFDPPMHLGDVVEDRTFLFCSVYDNGSTPDSPPVKQQSKSPSSPPFEVVPGLEIEIGGPCPDLDENRLGVGLVRGVMCMDGPNQGEPCGGLLNPHIYCETSPGAGDGVCDACDAMGGFTTEDEMFILLGTYFVPEPSSTLLAAAALTALGVLSRRRRAR